MYRPTGSSRDDSPRDGGRRVTPGTLLPWNAIDAVTPSPPTKSCPTKSP